MSATELQTKKQDLWVKVGWKRDVKSPCIKSGGDNEMFTYWKNIDSKLLVWVANICGCFSKYKWHMLNDIL